VPAVSELLATYQAVTHQSSEGSLEMTTPAVATTATDKQSPLFLSGLSLDQYHAVEQHFTQELVGFTKKHFEVILLQLLLYISIFQAEPFTAILIAHGRGQ